MEYRSKVATLFMNIDYALTQARPSAQDYRMTTIRMLLYHFLHTCVSSLHDRYPTDPPLPADVAKAMNAGELRLGRERFA